MKNFFFWQNKKTTLQSSLLFVFWSVILFTDPFLVATEETSFVKWAAEDEFACFGVNPHFGIVGFAIVGVEDGATLEFAIAPFHVVDDDHAYNWFVVECAFTLGAEFIFFAFN